MATYKIKGQRFVRKYTESETSPVYAASVQAQKIVDTFCDVPWQRTGVDSARMSYHTDEIVDEDRKLSGLDLNVEIRDQFDAALFCAGHKGGMHRAYANAAVYRYTMPDDAVGKTLVSLSARVTSDPYNSEGARLHVFTNSTGVIPTNCHVLRGENAAGELVEDGTTAAAVAKRTEQIVGKEAFWYPTTETCNLQPQTFNLQKYLFVLVALESYSTVRGNWLEGCSFIENAVEIETSAEIDGLSETALNELGETSGTAPSEIDMRIVANEDAKGKLWVQAVSYFTRRVLKKWSFDCEFSFGQNEMNVKVPNVCGEAELLSHFGGVFFEAWIGGEKYDCSNLYGCSNLRDGHSIELTRTSTVFARFNVYNGQNDRQTLWGSDSGNMTDPGDGSSETPRPQALSGGEMNHVRIVPYLVSGTLSTSEEPYAKVVGYALNRVVAEFDVDSKGRGFISEADFIRGIAYDIDWENFRSAVLGNGGIASAVGDVTAVKYRVVLGASGPIGPVNNLDTSTVVRAFSTLIERRYEPTAQRTLPSELATDGVLYGGCPTFAWRLDEPKSATVDQPSAGLFGCSYTAFQIQIAEESDDDGNVVYDSGVVRAPVQDANGRFVWTAPVCPSEGSAFAPVGNWKWRVAMYNAKFKPSSRESSNGWSDWSTFATALP